jgi:VCBS repeat-containing protein
MTVSGTTITDNGGGVETDNNVRLTGGVTLKSGTVTNLGTLEIAGAATLLSDKLANGLGTVQVDNGQRLTLNGAELSGGAINNFDGSGGGTIDVKTAASKIDGNATLTGGAVTAEAKLTLETMTVSGTVITDKGGGIELDNNVQLTGGATIQGQSSLLLGAITNLGTLEVSGTATLSNDTVTNTNHIVQVDSGQTLKLDNSTINVGTLTVDGEVDSTGTSLLSGVTIGNINNIKVVSGTLTIDPPTPVPFTNTGTIEVDAGSTLVLSGETVTNSNQTTKGTVQVDATDANHLGTLDLKNSAINGGTLVVNGLLDSDGTSFITGANVTNTGTFDVTSGTLTIDATSTFTNQGKLETNGGNLIVDTALSGNLEVKDASTLELGAAESAYANATVTFDAGATGTLKLDQAATGSGLSVAGLDDNKIDLANVAFGSNTTVSYSGTTSSGVLSVFENGTDVADIKLTGDYLGAHWALAKDASTGTSISEIPGAITGGLDAHGNAVEGTELTASVTDGGHAISGVTYQWQVLKDDGWTAAAGTNGLATYTPTEADEGLQLQVQLSFKDTNGNSDITTVSAGTVQEIAQPHLQVTINGAPVEGTAITASVVDPSGNEAISGSGITYQWYAGSTLVHTATGDNSYVPTEADEGLALTVTATFTDAANNVEYGTSAASAAVAEIAQPNLQVTINGAPVEGTKITASVVDPSGNETISGSGITYQWYAGSTLVHTATGDNSYVPTEAVEGLALTVKATFTDAAGNVEYGTSAASAAVAEIAQPNLQVTINGAPVQGTAITVSVVDPSGNETLAGGGITYQWYADGTPVHTATGDNSYIPTEADEGHALTVKATFTDAAGNIEYGTSAASAAVAEIAGGDLVVSLDSTTASEGTTIHVTGVTDGGAAVSSVTYDWQVQNSSGQWGEAHGTNGLATYTPIDADEHLQLQLVVTTNANDPTAKEQIIKSLGVVGESEGQLTINQGPQTASVSNDGTWHATGQFTVSNAGNGALTWSIVGGHNYASEPYQYGIHEFNVVKTVGNTLTTVFDDTFGTVPPAGPGILYGSSPSGTSLSDFNSGTYVQGNGEALIEGSHAGYLGSALGVNSYGDPVFGQFTTLLTATSYTTNDSTDGLRSGQSFTVSGLFDLTTPPDVNSRYGIRLSDRVSTATVATNDQPGTEVVDLGVIKNGNGTASVILSELNYETGVSDNLQIATITVNPGDNEIQLSLSNNAANNGVVTASYTLEKNVNGVEVADGTFTLGAVGHIFDNENWTKAQFYSFAVATTPSASFQTDSILQGTYGQLDLAQDGTWHYELNPGLASVKALAAGQIAYDNFQVEVMNAAGAQTTQTISVKVTGVNDAPVATAPAEIFNAVAHTNLNLRGIGLSASDADGGSSIETATLSVGEGIITIAAGDSGVTIISGNGTGSVSFSGTIAQINALLSTNTGTGAVVYNDSSTSPSIQTNLTLTIDDNGANGGTALSGSATSTIDVAPNGGSLNWADEIDPFAAPTQATPTKWVIPNSDGLTWTVFNGGGFTYDAISHLPTGGGIGSIQLADISTGAILQTITGVGLQLGDFGNFIAREHAIQSNIPWAGLIETHNHGPLSFTATDIRLANADGTFTEILGNNFSQSGDSQLTGSIAAVEQLDASLNVLRTINFGGGTSLGDFVSAISSDNLSQQFYNLMAEGNTKVAGFQSSAGVVSYFEIDDTPGNHTYTSLQTGIIGVNFGEATSGVTVNLGAGTAAWGTYQDTLTNISFVRGSKFADTIVGDAQSDYLDGGGAPAGGHDTLTGGAGTTFVFQQGYGALTITNFDQAGGLFDPAEHDTIQLNNLNGTPTVTYVPDGNSTDTVLNFGNNDVVTLLNVTQAEFTALNGTEFNNGNNGGSNKGPVIGSANNNVTYIGKPVTIDPAVTLSDSEATVSSVNVWISSGAQSGDELTILGNFDGTITNSDGSIIHYHFDNTPGTNNGQGPGIFLSNIGTTAATTADFQAALQLIQFSSTSGNPTAGGTDNSRTASWAAYDNANFSQTVTTTVNLNIVPLLTSMTLTVAKGGTTVLTNSDFSVTDPGHTSFRYSVDGVTGGQFEVFNGSNWVSAPTGGFTTAQIAAGQVEFVQDGSNTKPNFNIWASDGSNAGPSITPTVNFAATPQNLWGVEVYPSIVPGVHQLGVNPQYDAAAGIVVLAPGGEVTNYSTSATSFVDTRYVETLDPFFLPGPHAPQTVNMTTVDPPARSNFIIPNVGSSLTPEGIYVYKGQLNADGSGGNALWEIIATPDANGDGGVTFSNPIQIGTASNTQNTNYLLTESFKNNGPNPLTAMATSYDIAWDQYDGSHYSLELQITKFNNDGSFGSSTIFSPVITQGGTVDTAHMPAWQFRAIGSSTSAAYALAIAETNTSTGLDMIHFQAYDESGSPAAFNSNNLLFFNIQPDLSHYAAGATNQIVWQTIQSLSPYPGQTAQAIQFVQVSSNNGGKYAVVWNETVTDSAGTHDQVEFFIANGTNSYRQTFQIADGNAQNVRIGEFTDPANSNQDDVVVVCGDDFGTHILEYGVTNSGNTYTPLASFTDPTTQAFSNLTVMGDGRITLTYDNLVNPSPGDETSQYLFKTFDLRTSGLNVSAPRSPDGENKYFAGTHFADNVTGENGVNNEYYFVGQNTSDAGPTDHFTGGSNGGWNVAIFSDARSDYTITSGPGTATTVASNGTDTEHAGTLVVSNVQVLAFGPASDPTPHNNTIDVNGGTDVVLGGNSPITIEAGSTAEIDTAGSYSGSVTFEAATGTLVLDQPGAFTGVIGGISGSGQVLDLAAAGLGANAADNVQASTGQGSFNGATTTLTVTDTTNQNSLTFNLAGDLSNSTWTVTSDGHGGFDIVDPPAASVTPPAPVQTVASAANQTLVGTGAAADNFVFNFTGFGHDTVANFHPVTDTLEFDRSMFATAQAALDATHDDGLGNTVVVEGHDTVTLNGVLKAQLHVTDFHIV